MINNWQNIATSLAEPPRERKLQEQKVFRDSSNKLTLMGRGANPSPTQGRISVVVRNQGLGVGDMATCADHFDGAQQRFAEL